MSFRPLLVTDVVDETSSARSFRLRPQAEDRDHFRYRAGQSLVFKLEIGDQALERAYSLSSAPETDAELAITIQEVDDGRTSKWFNREVAPGDQLLASRPAGRFVLNGSSRPLTLLAAGSGITPIFSILKSALASTRRPVFLLYANRDPARAIFRNQIDRLADQHPDRFTARYHFDAEAGLITGDEVRSTLDQAPDAEIYVCGPEPFIALVRDQAEAASIPPSRLVTEDFGPPAPTVSAGSPVSAG